MNHSEANQPTNCKPIARDITRFSIPKKAHLSRFLTPRDIESSSSVQSKDRLNYTVCYTSFKTTLKASLNKGFLNKLFSGDFEVKGGAGERLGRLASLQLTIAVSQRRTGSRVSTTLISGSNRSVSDFIVYDDNGEWPRARAGPHSFSADGRRHPAALRLYVLVADDLDDRGAT